ncbi:putative outer membrane assembly protein [Salmonella enterica subsp. enterica serovar Alachua str. R6-377]|uniref:Putative outer membrane assembly protein n=1 Tax=Salmonella enterica subsp. enterica serovar Alachua str. R6-377 TaxID=913241 RepID=G5LQN4_SALET|nr:putative outer membrane assembly protein [Salmonella enterica subsp. enterica serovar Alachua str. R6-377]
MRRFLTTLMILLVVLVAGFSALVLLVNPNDFRAYMVQQVAARSEYQLQLDNICCPRLVVATGRAAALARMAATQHPFRANDANGARRQRTAGAG